MSILLCILKYCKILFNLYPDNFSSFNLIVELIKSLKSIINTFGKNFKLE